MLDRIPVQIQVTDALLALAAGWVAWTLYGYIYNVFWHPLARFPGPRLAAATSLYKAWIDCVAKSSFVHTLERLHAQYGECIPVNSENVEHPSHIDDQTPGDIVRVGPNEVCPTRCPATVVLPNG